MDSEKYAEIQEKIRKGKSPNDEGPYYHHSWWESYKGGIKGKLGGVIGGAIVGALTGAAVAAVAALIPAAGVGFLGAAGIMTAFAAAGSLYGAHEFGDIGKITGAVAATQKHAEARMKAFEESRFAELKHDIAEVRALVTGDMEGARRAASSSDAVPEIDDMDYRKTHYAKLKSKNGLVFWKVALIGLAVGAAAGALFVAGGLAGHLLDGLVGHGGALSSMGLYAASMTAFGALGASFGINRDALRQLFDTTDLWSKGITRSDSVRDHQLAAGREIENGHAKDKDKDKAIVTAVAPEHPSGAINYPTSETYHRDRVLAAAEKALMSFDHTRATPQ